MGGGIGGGGGGIGRGGIGGGGVTVLCSLIISTSADSGHIFGWRAGVAVTTYSCTFGWWVLLCGEGM